MTVKWQAWARHISRASVIGPILLVGCAATEPYQQPSLWSQTGANAANLAAMLEASADLVRGRTFAGTDAVAADGAINRLQHDRVKPLTDTTTTASSSGASGGGAGAGSSQGN
jgi:type IV pilus biogenesis protein CpaD/CtpE